MKNISVTRILLCITVTLLSITCVQTYPSNAAAKVQENTAALKFLGNWNLPPMIFLDKGHPKGIVVDIAKALSEKMGKQIEVEAMDWSTAQKTVADGNADALLQINETPERSLIYDFSEPLLESRFSMFTILHGPGLKGMTELEGLRVGVEKNGYPAGLIKKDPLIILVEVPTLLEGFKQMQAGELDVIVADEWVGAYLVAKNGFSGVSVAGDPLAVLQSAIAVKKGNKALLDAVNNGLRAMKQDGTFQEILDDWEPAEVVIQTREQIRMNLFRIGFVVFGFLLIFFMVWTRLLMKQLRRNKELSKALQEDIAEREQLENSMVESETRYHAMYESIADTLIVVERETGRIMDANPSASRMYGYEHDELITMNASVLAVDPDAALTRIKSAGAHFPLCYHKNKSGKTFPVEILVCRFLYKGVDCIIATSRDISERLSIEEELLRSKNEAEQSNLAKSQFLANMSHEIRNPMNGFIGMLQLLERTELTAEQKEFVKISKDSSFSLLALINDVLDYSKIEAGKMTLESILFSPFEETNKIISMMSPAACKKSLVLSLHVAPDVPEQLIGDPFRFSQVMTNLISNSVKFTETGRIDVFIKTLDDVYENTIMLQCSVQDTGIGISRDKMDLLFKSFSQIDSSNTRKYGGTGLGLAISKRIVDLMGGTIWVESEKGSGSAFHFTCSMNKVPGDWTDKVVPVVEKVESIPTSGTNILLAEDDVVGRMIVMHFAKTKKWTITLAKDGQEALDLYAAKSFHMILMDVQMPVLDGYAATAAIRRKESGTGIHIPIIAITANALKGDRERCLEAGMDDYLSKPLDLDILTATVEKWHTNHRH